jgi:hypothetical protein
MLTFPFSRHSNKKYWHFHNSTLIINTVVFVQFCIMSSILHLTRHVINLLIWCFKAGKILFSFLFDIHIWLSGCDTFWFCRGTTVCGLWLCYWSINPFLCWIRFSFHFLYCDFPLLTHAVKEKWGCTYQMWYILYTKLVAQKCQKKKKTSSTIWSFTVAKTSKPINFWRACMIGICGTNLFIMYYHMHI